MPKTVSGRWHPAGPGPRFDGRAPIPTRTTRSPSVSRPYGEDYGIIRTVARGHVTAVILAVEPLHTLTVLAIAYAGE